MSGFYSLKAELPNGDVFDFADLKGKTVLIVNIASKWYVVLFYASSLRLTGKLRNQRIHSPT